MQYFRKSIPSQAIIFSDGSGFKGFEIVTHEIGILATEDAGIIREIEACIAGHRGGCEVITADEYLSLKSQKKSSPLTPQWREEWQPRKHPLKGPDRLSAVPVAAAEPQRPAPVQAPADGAAAFRPKTSKA